MRPRLRAKLRTGQQTMGGKKVDYRWWELLPVIRLSGLLTSQIAKQHSRHTPAPRPHKHDYLVPTKGKFNLLAGWGGTTTRRQSTRRSYESRLMVLSRLSAQRLPKLAYQNRSNKKPRILGIMG